MYHALYMAVALTFAEQLRKDLIALQEGRRVSSLCAKWAPTPKGSPTTPPSIPRHLNT